MYRQLLTLLLACALLAGASLAEQTKKQAATKPRKAKTQATKSQVPKAKPGPPNAESKAKEEVIEAAKAHKSNLESLIKLIEEEVKIRTAELDRNKQLFSEGILPKIRVEESEALLASAKMKLNAPQKEIEQTDHLITETVAEEQLARMPKPKVGSYTTTNALIRYLGPSQWTLENISKVSSFFIGNFGRQLPISAFGQSAVHDRMNFDHRNSVDVAIHPDSAEGQALMSYLRSQGIPFLAFRSAVAGAATGAHIHIGHPSHRIR